MITYDTAKHIAQHGVYAERAKLAADETAPPEILVFLAADSSPAVRTALAQNPRLPAPAARILAKDALLAVRVQVAQHVARLWPERVNHEPEALHQLAREALELLALDHTLAVREALASAIADVAFAPPSVVQQLALDAAQSVAEPVLRYCAQLSDEALIDLLSQRSESWARQAIAARQTLSARVVDAVIQTKDEAATARVLANDGAALTAPQWEFFIHESKSRPELQAGLAARADLPQAAAARMAEFVDAAIFNTLASRSDFDADLVREIVQVARRRIDWVQAGKLPAIIRVRDLFDAGKLNDDALRDAMAWRDDECVKLALALLARLLPSIVAVLLGSKNAKAIAALCWRAGLAARTALALQKYQNIPPFELLHPRGGADYALTEAELLWQLEFYGVKG